MKFMAVNGTHTVYLPERDTRQEAIEFFEGLFSLRWMHLCWEYEIIEIKKPESKEASSIASFLSRSGAGGGKELEIMSMSKKKTKIEVPPEVSEYMAELGRRGGKANKGKPGRSEICRKAVQARWAKYRAKKAEEEEAKSRE